MTFFLQHSYASKIAEKVDDRRPPSWPRDVGILNKKNLLRLVRRREKEGRKEGRGEERKEGRKAGRKEGKEEGRKEGRKGGRKEGSGEP